MEFHCICLVKDQEDDYEDELLSSADPLNEVSYRCTFYYLRQIVATSCANMIFYQINLVNHLFESLAKFSENDRPFFQHLFQV